MNARLVALASSAFFTGLLLLSTASGADDAYRPAPRFEGDRLPVPPQQNAPWSPPKTSLPENVVTAAALLFHQGLPDPRGCEYRAVELGGTAWILATHAWVLPAEDKETRRFAVAWDGLIYPVLKLEGPADLRADAVAAIRDDEAMRVRESARIKEMNGGQGEFSRYPWEARNAEQGVAPGTLLPLKLCFLLRLGEAELAEGMWRSWITGVNASDLFRADPYPGMAADWAWSLFDRAFGAHVRKDDQLALLTLRDLVPFHRAMIRTAKERFRRDPRLEPPQQLDGMLADQERRGQDKSRETACDGGNRQGGTHRGPHPQLGGRRIRDSDRLPRFD
jgi:hypothetical protein